MHPPGDSLSEAIERHAAGDLAGAEARYRALLARSGETAIVLRMLAVALSQTGRHGEALESARRAVSSAPADAAARFCLATCLNGAARLEEAAEQYLLVLRAEPGHFDALNNLGNLRARMGDPAAAISCYEQALHVQPDSATLSANLGIALAAAGQADRAVDATARAVALEQNDADLWFHHGNVLREAGRREQAMDAYRRCAALDPHRADAWYNLGNTQSALGDTAGAADAFAHAVARAPDLAGGWRNLGNARLRMAEPEAAAAAYRRAVELAPRDPDALTGLGIALNELRRPAEALEAFTASIAADPAGAPAYLGLGKILRDAGQFVDAVRAFERSAALDPALAEAHELKATALWNHGRIDDALSAHAEAVRVSGGAARTLANYAFACNYSHRSGPDAVAERHFEYGAALQRAAGAPFAARADARACAPLRIGFVSRDLRRHSVAYFLRPLFERRDSSGFRFACYFNARKGDEVTGWFRHSADLWTDCEAMSDDELAARIAADRIDILLDLNGLTDGNRLSLFARRAAPVQATWLGYPTTSGLAAMDYRITDWEVDPQGSERLGTETPVRLAPSYFCYGGQDAGVGVGPPPALERGSVTFGSFNNLVKMSPACMRLWAGVLAAVPGSRLLIKSKALVDGKSRDDLEQRFRALGVDAGRLELCGWREGTAEHLETYHRVDVALDSLPYNGATTTCESLWMGVPVVTLRGATHAGRMGASILGAAGCGDWIARDEADYVARAAALAADLPALARTRLELRARLRGSRLMDAGAFARALEAAFVKMAGERGGLR